MRFIKPIFICALIFAVASLAGCASRRQLQRIESQLDRIERSSSETNTKVTELDSLYQAQEETQRAFLARLQESIDEFETRMDQLNNKLNDLTDRINQIQAGGGSRIVPNTPVDSTDTTSQTHQTEIDPGIIFNSAFKNLQAGNHQIAILGFNEYITQFPNTDLTDDAQFWLGECYYQMDPPDFARAKAEFQKVLDKYPKSDRLSAAKFKLARCHEELGERDVAIRLYREILKDYPQTAEANRAKIQLEGLGVKQE